MYHGAAGGYEGGAALYRFAEGRGFCRIITPDCFWKGECFMGAYSRQYSYEYLAGACCGYGVLYPMQTFSKQREVDFGQIPCFVESNSEEDVQLLKDIASALSEKVYEASSEQRKSLHLAAVFTCNFTNHMYVLAAELLKKYGLPFEAMLPLIDETARKVHELEPLAAQTGPAVRYDENVIDEHLRMLADEPQMLELYREISENIHRLAIR